MDLLLAEALSRRVALRRLAVAPTSLLKTLPCPVAWLDREGRVLVWTEEAAALCPGLQEGRFWDEVASSLPEGIRVEARSWPAGTLLYFQKEVSLEKERFAVMGQMAAVAAHEIRNPLTAIQGFLQLLQKDLESPRHKEYLRIALEEMERIAHLTQDMLVMVRQPLRGEASSLAEGVAAAWEILRPLAEAGGHRLEVDMPQGSLKVPLSESHLRQILLNLFRNALEAMPEGGTVRVRAWKRAGEMGFSVEDEGPGIPPEEIPKIFSPLYTTKKGGTGLGLPVVGVLVQMSGGKVDVASLPKGGTAFRLSWILPAGAAPGDGRYNRSDDGGTSAPAQ